MQSACHARCRATFEYDGAPSAHLVLSARRRGLSKWPKHPSAERCWSCVSSRSLLRATAAAVLFAVGAITIEKAHGLALIDVLTAPIAFVVYGGPPLLALGGTPWDAARWHTNASDAQTRLLLGTLFGAWPLTILGTALWRPANREAD